MSALAHLIDHTALRPETSAADVRNLCTQARELGFRTVCVNPSRVAQAVEELTGSPVDVCTVIGFPLGATSTAAKVAETQQALTDGARELDLVINLGLVADGDWPGVEGDIRAVVSAAHDQAAAMGCPAPTVKAILETAALEEYEIVAACRAVQAAGADFVKTSTGFHPAGGATVAAVNLLRTTVGPGFGVKASGGIRTSVDLQELVAAGANRIGASAGAQLLG